jgi:D-beta-D-heptose 7-phosphate kinase/D-beta-D-heptose 1-phosphate adenosyltransferase
VSSSRYKIATPTEATRWRARQQGRIVLTNGVFDLLHPGHVDYLEAARAVGDALIVAVNSDSSVRLLDKGPDRPILPLDDRARLLAGLGCVDLVVPFDDATPLSLIQMLRPDVLCKGGDYTRATIVGADFVEQQGGFVQVIPWIPGYSTTSLIGRLRAQ